MLTKLTVKTPLRQFSFYQSNHFFPPVQHQMYTDQSSLKGFHYFHCFRILLLNYDHDMHISIKIAALKSVVLTKQMMITERH